MSQEERFSQIKDELYSLMYEVAGDDRIMPETGLIMVVSLDLARAANEYAQALATGQPNHIAEKKALLKSFLGWLIEIE